MADLFTIDDVRVALKLFRSRARISVPLSPTVHATARFQDDAYTVTVHESSGMQTHVLLADSDEDMLERFLAFKGLVHRLNNGCAVDLDAELARIAYSPETEGEVLQEGGVS